MAGKKEKPLIDVNPENSKEILAAAEEYRDWQGKRLAALKKEVEFKQKILDLVKEAKLQRLPDGTISFALDGIKITIKPSQETVQVKDIITEE